MSPAATLVPPGIAVTDVLMSDSVNFKVTFAAVASFLVMPYKTARLSK